MPAAGILHIGVAGNGEGPGHHRHPEARDDGGDGAAGHFFFLVVPGDQDDEGQHGARHAAAQMGVDVGHRAAMRHRRHQGRKQRAPRHPAHQVGTRRAGMEAEGEQGRQGGHDGARCAHRQHIGSVQHHGGHRAGKAAGEIDGGEPADADHRLQQKAHDQEGDEIADQMGGRAMQGGGGEQPPPFALPQHLDAVGSAHGQQGEMARRIGRHPVGGRAQFGQEARHQDGAEGQGEPGNAAQQPAGISRAAPFPAAAGARAREDRRRAAAARFPNVLDKTPRGPMEPRGWINLAFRPVKPKR